MDERAGFKLLFFWSGLVVYHLRFEGNIEFHCFSPTAWTVSCWCAPDTGSWHSFSSSTARGFEPLRAEPNGFQVHVLSRSDTLSLACMDWSLQHCALQMGLMWYKALEASRISIVAALEELRVRSCSGSWSSAEGSRLVVPIGGSSADDMPLRRVGP